MTTSTEEEPDSHGDASQDAASNDPEANLRERREVLMGAFALAAAMPFGVSAAYRGALLASLMGGPGPAPVPIPVPPLEGCGEYAKYHDDGENCDNGTKFNCGGPDDSGTLQFACDGDVADDFECLGTFDCHTSFVCQDSFDAEDCHTDFECITCSKFSDPGGDTPCVVPEPGS